MQEAIPLLERVSGDRIRHELNHIVVDSQNHQILERLDRLKLLEAIHPALRWDEWLKDRFRGLPDQKPDPDWGLEAQTGVWDLKRSLAYIIWLLRLTPKLAHQVSERLKMPVELRNIIQAAINLWNELPGVSDRPPSQIVARLDEIPALARYAVFLAASEPELRQVLLDYVQRWQKITPVHDGHYLREIGLPPGPAYRTILSTLRGAWLDGEIASADQEEALLDKLLTDLAP
jgi:tRNA nucleotidyltransferase (CCA-adding enzyme)